DRVLEPALVVVDRVGEVVVRVALERDLRCEVAVLDAAFGDLVPDRAAREDLERVEVEMDRVRIAGEVDELPDLVHAEHREEGRPVLEMRGDGADATG